MIEASKPHLAHTRGHQNGRIHAKRIQEGRRLICGWANFIDGAAGKQAKSEKVVNLR